MTMHMDKLCPLSFERDLLLNLNYDDITEHCYKVRGHVQNVTATRAFARVTVSQTNIVGSMGKWKEAKDAMPHRYSSTCHGSLQVNSRC
jgi:hypothetical protein